MKIGIDGEQLDCDKGCEFRTDSCFWLGVFSHMNNNSHKSLELQLSKLALNIISLYITNLRHCEDRQARKLMECHLDFKVKIDSCYFSLNMFFYKEHQSHGVNHITDIKL